MSSYKTSNGLIESIKNRISTPTNQSTFNTDDILRFANEEMFLNVVPLIMSLHEDHFLYDQTVALEANKSSYTIPERAIGNKLRDIQYVDQNGNHFEMTRLGIGDIPERQNSFTTNRIYRYYLKNNKVVLLPSVGDSVTGSLIFYYYIRPNNLVEESRIGIIQNINASTGEITLDSIPDNFTTSIRYDFYKQESPHSHLAIDLTSSNIDTSTKIITFTAADIPDELAVGDHIAQRCECIIPQIPSDLHVLLAQYTSERILESIGDTEGLGNAKATTGKMEFRTGTIIDSRVDDSPQKLVNKHSPLRAGLASRRRRF